MSLFKFTEVHDRAEFAIRFGNYGKREAPRGGKGSYKVLFKHVSIEAIYGLALTMGYPIGRHVAWTYVCLDWNGVLYNVCFTLGLAGNSRF